MLSWPLSNTMTCTQWVNSNPRGSRGLGPAGKAFGPYMRVVLVPSCLVSLRVDAVAGKPVAVT